MMYQHRPKKKKHPKIPIFSLYQLLLRPYREYFFSCFFFQNILLPKPYNANMQRNVKGVHEETDMRHCPFQELYKTIAL